MQRGHLEQSPPLAIHPARQLEVAHLQGDAQRLGHKHQADHRQQQPLPRHHRHQRQRCTQRQAARVPHEQLRRVGVVPQERHQRANQRKTEGRQVDLLLQIGNRTVTGKGDGARAAAKAVHPIGQVDAVAHRHHQEDRHRDDQGADPEEVLEPRHAHIVPLRRPKIEHQGDDRGKEQLKAAFHARAHSLALGVDTLDALPVVHPTQHGVRGQAEEQKQRALADGVQADQVGNVQHPGDQQHRHHKQNAAHRRRARLGLVAPRQLNANLLADSLALQKIDQGPAPDHGNDKTDCAQRQGIGHARLKRIGPH